MTRALVALLVVAIVALVGIARAAEPANTAKADELFRQAREFQQKKQFDKALELYRQSWKLRPTYEVSANMGQLELALGHHRDAAEHLSHAISRIPPFAQEAAELRRALEPSLALAEKHVAKIHIAISGSHAKLSLEVDGRQVNPWEFDNGVHLDPGEHVFRLAGPSIRSIEKKVMAEAGTTQTVHFDPKSERSATSPAPSPAAGAAPQDALTPDQSAKEGTSSIKLPLLITGAAVTVIALGTGIGFSIAASNSNDDAEALYNELRAEAGGDPNFCEAPPSDRVQRCRLLGETLDDRNSQRNIERAAYITAGIGAAATLGVWLLWPGDPGPGLLARVTPVERGAFATIGGRF